MYLSKPTLLCGLTFNCVKSQMKYIPLSGGDVEQATDTTPNVRTAIRMNLEVSDDTFILGPERRSDGICDDNPEAVGLSPLLQGSLDLTDNETSNRQSLRCTGRSTLPGVSKWTLLQ